MTQPSENPLTPIHATRHDDWTHARQAAFLHELAASHCVSTAAKAVGMSRQSAYALRARLKGEPFDRAWQAALLNRFDALAEAAMERVEQGPATWNEETWLDYAASLEGDDREEDAS